MLQAEITAILTAFIRKQHHQSWFLLLRRSLQALAERRDPGDLSTLDDPGALEEIRRVLGT